jgi:hypothetical protein
MNRILALLVFALVACVDPLAPPTWHRRNVTLCTVEIGAGTFACENLNCEVYGYPGGPITQWRDCRPA